MLRSIMFFGSTRRPRPPEARESAPTAPVECSAESPYPPVEPGFPARSIEEILAPHNDLVQRIKLCYGMDKTSFETDLMPLIRRYAEFVHLLPATSENFFSGVGGLLRMGLEIGFFSLQGADGQIFSGGTTITQRQDLEPRWRYAAFIAGLCSEIHRAFSHVIVIDKQGTEWPPYLQPLHAWLDSQRAQRYFLRWISSGRETRSLGMFALPQIVPSTTMQHLAAGNSLVVPHMLACVSGMAAYPQRNILVELVRHAAALVIDRELRARAERSGRPQHGAHSERYLIDAMRRLVASSTTWIPNRPKSRVWYSRSGLFVLWPNACADIGRLVEADGLPGIPKVPETILEILIESGTIEPRSDVVATWTIYPPDATVPVEAVKFASPGVLFGEFASDLQPIPSDLSRPTRGETTEGPPRRNETPPVAQQLPLPMDASPVSSEPTATAGVGPHARRDPSTRTPAEVRLTPVSKRAAEESTAAVHPRFSLHAPLSLNTGLRQALAEIIATLNHDDESSAACRLPSGIFIPLHQLECRRVDSALAIRALSEASMLVASPSGGTNKTMMHDFGGDKVLGVVVHARFVSGFDPADCQSAGEHDADA